MKRCDQVERVKVKRINNTRAAIRTRWAEQLFFILSQNKKNTANKKKNDTKARNGRKKEAREKEEKKAQRHINFSCHI